MFKRCLQIVIGVAGLVPMAAGLAGIIFGPSMITGDAGASISMDSHYRYLSGLLLGIGIAFWTTIPAIERKGDRFRLLSAIVVIGGLARFTSLWTVGMPDKSMQFGLIMELVIVPLLAIWQYLLERERSS